jgi:hypothetical protein
MGELINLNPKVALVDADFPAAITRDSEYLAADAAHTAATDPHPFYLTQVEGDERYPQYKKVFFLTGTTQGSNTNTVHGLDYTKILSFSGIVKVDISNSVGFIPLIAPGGLIGFPGYSYSLYLDAGNIFCRLHPTDSANILSRQITANILYSL